jgi:hypothetical protein
LFVAMTVVVVCTTDVFYFRCEIVIKNSSSL